MTFAAARSVTISAELDALPFNQPSQKAIMAYAEIDKLTRDQRECVHEFGFAIVKACMDMGITQPNRIRFLVHTIWSGARQPGQRMGKGSTSAIAKLDWLLLQQNCEIPAKTLLRTLADDNFFFVPRNPTATMIEASMDATNHFGIVSKREKHQRRLQAAISAYVKGYFT